MYFECSKSAPTIASQPFVNEVVNADQTTTIRKVSHRTADGDKPAIHFLFEDADAIVWLFASESDRDSEYDTIIAATQATGGGGGGDTSSLATEGTLVAFKNNIGDGKDTPAASTSVEATLFAYLKLLINTELGGNTTLAALSTALGARNDAMAGAPDDVASLISLIKYIGNSRASEGTLSDLLIAAQDLEAAFGGITDPAAVSDNAAATHISLLKRLLAKIPALGQALAAGSLPVVLASDATSKVSLPPNGTISSYNITTTAVAATWDMFILGCKMLSFQVTGTFVATMVLEASDDNSTWVQIPIRNNNTRAVATSVTATGIYQVNTNHRYIRLRCSAYTSGTAAVRVNCVFDSSDVLTQDSMTVSGSVSITGTPTTNATLVPSTSQGGGVLSGLVGTAAGSGVIKASAGTLLGGFISNPGTAPAWVKFFNATTATPGSGTPVMRVMCPAGQTVPLDAVGGYGLRFTTGISYTFVGGAADTDATALNAAIAVNFVFV